MKTSGGKSKQTYKDPFLLVNIPFNFLVHRLGGLEDMEKRRPFLDETGIKGNIDITLSGDLTDLENVRKQLKQYGLDIIEAEREVEVLVIKDKPKE